MYQGKITKWNDMRMSSEDDNHHHVFSFFSICIPYPTASPATSDCLSDLYRLKQRERESCSIYFLLFTFLPLLLLFFLMTMMVATQISSYSYIFCLFCGWKFPRGSRKCRGGGISNAIPLVEIIITLIMSLEESRNQPRKNRKEKTGNNILQNGGLLGFFQCRV